MGLRYKKRLFILLLLLATIHIFSMNAWAVENFSDLDQALNQEQATRDRGTSIWVEFLQLILVLLLILGAAWSIIRLVGRKTVNRVQGTWLHVVDEVVLGQNRGIVLCEAGGKVYALGVTDHSITVLFQVDNSKLLEEIGQGTYHLQATVAETPDLKKILTGFFKKANNDSSQDFQALIKEQVNRLDEIASRQEPKVPGQESSDHGND